MPSLLKDPNRGFHVWNITELFGHSPNGQYVPNKDDLVYDTANKIRYKTESVNYITGLSELSVFELADNSMEINGIDYFISDGNSNTDDSLRIYIDYSLQDHVMRFDARLVVPSSQAAYVRVYKGGNISGADAQVISLYKNPMSVYPSTDIPLEVADTPQQNTPTMKVPAIAYCTAELFDGDIVTAVILSSNLTKLSTTRMVVHRTELVRRSNSLNRYITGIELLSPAQQVDNPRIIEVPINATLDSISMMGVVRYSDGQSETIPLTGDKFKLVGIEGYSSTVPGQAKDIILEYRLNNAERAINSNTSNQRILTETYKFLSVMGNGVVDAESPAYGVKIYGYPKWNPSLLEYIMEYWVHIKDFGVFYATPYVREELSGSRFNGHNLGIYQRYYVTLNLNDINATYANYRHYQAMDVSLTKLGNAKDAPLWSVAHQDSTTRYAIEGHAIKGSVIQTIPNRLWNMSFVANGMVLDTWLENTYYKAKPIYNPGLTLVPKRPTHVSFATITGTVLGEINLNSLQWYMPFQAAGNFNNGDTIIMIFIYREISQPDEKLAVGAAPFIDIT